MASLHAKLEQHPYRDQVIGDRVEILFDVGDGSRCFYPGQIRKAMISLDDNDEVDIQHFVQFDDGDTHWFRLADEEKEGRLQWLKPQPAAAENATSSDTKRPSKKQKRNNTDEEDDESADSASDSSNSSVHEEEATATPAVPDPLPKTFDDIIRYMDQVEPDKNYYERQEDSRGQASKTRGKVRKFARENPDHPAVRHWIQTSKWQPPDQESLFALMDLIKTMIK